MHQHELLPSWTQPIGTVVIVLQKCSISLAQYNQQTQRCKHELRDRFFLIGQHIVQTLDTPHDQCEIFDPRTGLPLRSPHGSRRLDDVAVACSSLGYAAKKQGACATLIHPTWGDAVYPATLISTAPISTVTQRLSQRSLNLKVFESQSSCRDQRKFSPTLFSRTYAVC